MLTETLANQREYYRQWWINIVYNFSLSAATFL
jgi:hypothetical protein